MGPIASIALHGLITGPLQKMFEPALRTAGYVSNANLPNVIPDIGTLLELYVMGLIKQNTLKQLTRWHGVDFRDAKEGTAFGKAWRAALEANQGFPDPAMIMRGLRTGLIDNADYHKWMRRHKVATSDVKAYLEKMNYEPLGGIELFALQNRKLIADDTVSLHLRDRGITNPDLLTAVKQLRFTVPPVTDLLHFAQVNATDPAVIARFGLGDEFDRFWQGDLQEGLESNGISERWAHIYWQAHWIRASMETGMRALQRLRPGRVPAAQVFTRADFENLARENDILPFWRERLRLLAYNPPGLRFIRSMYQTGQIVEADVNEAYQDLGYSPEVSPRLAATETVLKNRALATQGHGYTIAKIIALFKENVLSADEARAGYAQLGYDRFTADFGLSAAERDLQADMLKHLIALLRLQYLHGMTDDATAIAKLTALNLTSDRVTLLIGTWQAEKEIHAPHATLATLNSWTCKGLMDLAEYTRRLTNLGWQPDDIQRMVAVQAECLQRHRAKELAAVEVQYRKAAMHAFQEANEMEEADLLEFVAQVDANAAEQLSQVHTAAEKLAIKERAKLATAKARADRRRAKAQERREVQDLPPP